MMDDSSTSCHKKGRKRRQLRFYSLNPRIFQLLLFIVCLKALNAADPYISLYVSANGNQQVINSLFLNKLSRVTVGGTGNDDCKTGACNVQANQEVILYFNEGITSFQSMLSLIHI